MTLAEDIYQRVLNNQGTSRQALCRELGLSDYRLNRVFRHIERDLVGRCLVHDHDRGVWIVEIIESQCLGMVWVGREEGGYMQCGEKPAFADLRCYLHSCLESMEMVALKRKVAYLAGPQDPNRYTFIQLALVEVEELLDELRPISPLTRHEAEQRTRLLEMLTAARTYLKSRRRRRLSESWIPPEAWERHKASSINPFELSLKKHFVVLEVPVDATKEEVLKAWKKLARRYHPDMGGGDEERMKAVNLAKERIFRIRRWDRDEK